MRWIAILLVGLALACVARPARADVIDGEWCSADGRHLTIKGPELVTPAGKHISGDYGRHSFNYVVPPAEPGSGQTVAMQLMNEMTVHLRQGADPAATAQAPVQVWKRCTPGISDAAPQRAGGKPA